jgi:hypothetical protein
LLAAGLRAKSSPIIVKHFEQSESQLEQIVIKTVPQQQMTQQYFRQIIDWVHAEKACCTGAVRVCVLLLSDCAEFD